MPMVLLLLLVFIGLSSALPTPMCVGAVYTSFRAYADSTTTGPELRRAALSPVGTPTSPLDVYHLDAAQDYLTSVKAPAASTSVAEFAVGQRYFCIKTIEDIVQCYDLATDSFTQLNTSYIDNFVAVPEVKLGMSALAVTDSGTVCLASLEPPQLRIQCLKPSGIVGPFFYNISTINPTSISLMASSEELLVVLVKGFLNSSIWVNAGGTCVKFDSWSGTLLTSTFFSGFMYHFTDTSIVKCRENCTEIQHNEQQALTGQNVEIFPQTSGEVAFVGASQNNTITFFWAKNNVLTKSVSRPLGLGETTLLGGISSQDGTTVLVAVLEVSEYFEYSIIFFAFNATSHLEYSITPFNYFTGSYDCTFADNKICCSFCTNELMTVECVVLNEKTLSLTQLHNAPVNYTYNGGCITTIWVADTTVCASYGLNTDTEIMSSMKVDCFDVITEEHTFNQTIDLNNTAALTDIVVGSFTAKTTQGSAEFNGKCSLGPAITQNLTWNSSQLVITGYLEITSSVIITNSTIISTNLVLSGTLQISSDSLLNVSGCISSNNGQVLVKVPPKDLDSGVSKEILVISQGANCSLSGLRVSLLGKNSSDACVATLITKVSSVYVVLTCTSEAAPTWYYGVVAVIVILFITSAIVMMVVPKFRRKIFPYRDKKRAVTHDSEF